MFRCAKAQQAGGPKRSGPLGLLFPYKEHISLPAKKQWKVLSKDGYRKCFTL